MASIYQIADKYQLIQQMIEEGTPPEVFAEALQAIDGEASEKLEAYAMVLKNIDSDINGVDAEIKRLQERKRSMESNVARMKENMAMLLQTVEGNKLKTDKFTFSFRKSTVVKVEDETIIPPQFIKTEWKVSKSDLAKALKEGEQIPGARLVENQSLQIK